MQTLLLFSELSYIKVHPLLTQASKLPNGKHHLEWKNHLPGFGQWCSGSVFSEVMEHVWDELEMCLGSRTKYATWGPDLIYTLVAKCKSNPHTKVPVSSILPFLANKVAKGGRANCHINISDVWTKKIQMNPVSHSDMTRSDFTALQLFVVCSTLSSYALKAIILLANSAARRTFL